MSRQTHDVTSDTNSSTTTWDGVPGDADGIRCHSTAIECRRNPETWLEETINTFIIRSRKMCRCFNNKGVIPSLLRRADGIDTLNMANNKQVVYLLLSVVIADLDFVGPSPASSLDVTLIL